jgi:hypothetical protein
MGSAAAVGYWIAGTLLGLGAANETKNHYESKKEKAERNIESRNKEIEAKNKIIESKNSKNERIKRIYSNTTDNSTGKEVGGLFNQSNNQSMVENRTGGMFRQSNKRLQNSNRISNLFSDSNSDLTQ